MTLLQKSNSTNPQAAKSKVKASCNVPSLTSPVTRLPRSSSGLLGQIGNKAFTSRCPTSKKSEKRGPRPSSALLGRAGNRDLHRAVRQTRRGACDGRRHPLVKQDTRGLSLPGRRLRGCLRVTYAPSNQLWCSTCQVKICRWARLHVFCAITFPRSHTARVH